MARRTIKRYLAMCLAVVMLLTVLPVGVYAADGAPFEDGAAREDLAASGSMDLSSRKKQSWMSSQGWSQWKTLPRSRRFRITRPSFPA